MNFNSIKISPEKAMVFFRAYLLCVKLQFSAQYDKLQNIAKQQNCKMRHLR